MAAKTKYYIVDSDGNKHTRTSARVYTHMVVFRANLDCQRERAASEVERKHHAKNYAYHAREAGPGRKYEHSDTEMAQHKEIAVMTCDEYVQQAVERCIARINEDGMGKHADKCIDVGWCGRLDLAEKLAQKWTQYGIVQIFEAKVE